MIKIRHKLRHGCTLIIVRLWIFLMAFLCLGCETKQERIAALPLHQTLEYRQEPVVRDRLLQGLRSFDASRRMESIRTLMQLTDGDPFGYVSWRSPEENLSAIKLWEQYLASLDASETES